MLAYPTLGFGKSAMLRTLPCSQRSTEGSPC